MSWSSIVIEVLKAAGTLGFSLLGKFKKTTPVSRDEFSEEVKDTKDNAARIEDHWKDIFDKGKDGGS